MSGVALVIPDVVLRLSNLLIPAGVRMLHDPKVDDVCKAHILTLLVIHKDRGARMQLGLDTQSMESLLGPLFGAAPLVRECIAVLVHAALAACSNDCEATGPIAVHVRAMLLLYERRRHTRAIAVSILASLLSVDSREFNATILNCALKAMVDGSATVRRAFVYLIARYMHLSQDEFEPEQSPEGLAFFVRKDPLDFAQNRALLLPPKLRGFVEFMRGDPDPVIAQAAAMILNDPVNSGIEKAFEEDAMNIHYFVHCSLFSKDAAAPIKMGSYDDGLFSIDELDLFEELDGLGRPTFVSFDLRHAELAWGTESGFVQCAQNRWKVGDFAVTAILYLSETMLAAATADGVIRIYRAGDPNPVESFRPGIGAGPTVIAGRPPIVFVAQGEGDILVWDIAALLLIDYVRVPVRVEHMVVIGDRLFCGLATGLILEIGVESREICREFDSYIGRKIIRMGEWRERLYTVFESGEVFLWEAGGEVKKLYGGTEKTIDFVMHPVFAKAIVIANGQVSVLSLESGELVGLPEETAAVACCVDSVKPMAAIVRANGSIGVWKFPR
jgi:hypothetical protein